MGYEQLHEFWTCGAQTRRGLKPGIHGCRRGGGSIPRCSDSVILVGDRQVAIPVVIGATVEPSL